MEFALAPANATDLKIGYKMLVEHTDLEVIGDKAYISADIATELAERNRLILRTLPRRNQKVQMSAKVRKLYNSVRQIIETVNGQLTEHLNIEINQAHTPLGSMYRSAN